MEAPFSKLAFTAQRIADAANIAFWMENHSSTQGHHITVIRTATVRLAELVAEMDAAIEAAKLGRAA